MNIDKKVMILENAYAAVLAENVYYLTQAGILEKVTEQKKQNQMASGRMQVRQFGITEAKEVFTTVSDIFNCAKWKTEEVEESFIASAKSCKLCTFAKKMGAGSPCEMYCLNPMESLVKGLDENYQFKVQGTLYDGCDSCSVWVYK